MSFTDVLGQYASNRLDSAMQPFSDPEAYLRQRLQAEEEERKKKEREDAAKAEAEQQQAQQRAVEEAQRTQQTQQQPGQPAVPGQSGAVIPPGMANPNQFGSAIAQGQTAEPVAPSQGGPAPQVQEQPNIEEQRRLQQAQAEQAQQAAQPVAPVAPEPAPQAVQQPQPAPQAQAPAAPVAPQMPQLPQPGPAVQVAGPAAVPPQETGQGIRMPAPAAPQQAAPQMSMEERIAAATQRAQERAGTTPAATTAPQAAPAAAPAPVADHTDTVAGIYNDPAKLIEYSRNEANPREGRLMAAKLLKQQVKNETEKAEAEDILRKAQETGDTTFIDRALRKKSEEGSMLKAMLYSRLGLTKLAEDEQIKLGAGSKWASTIGPNGERALVQYDATGLPIAGMDANGRELTSKQLASFGASSTLLKGANVGGQTYRDPGTGQTLTKVDTQQGPMYYDKAGNRVVPKGEPVPLTAGSDISTQLQLSQMKRQQAFVGQTATERMRSFREVNNERTLAGMPPLTPEQMGLNANGELIGQQQPGMPPTPAAPGAPGTGFSDPSIKVLSGARTTDQQAALYQQSVANGTPGVLPNGNPVAQPGTSAHERNGAIDVDNKSLTRAGRAELAAKGYYQPLPNDPNHWELLPGRQAAPVAPPVAAPVAGPAVPQTPAQMQAARQAAAAGMKTEATKTAENIVADREALPKIEASAENTLTTLKDVLTHPGFSDVVGVPNVITGIWTPPGTDARNFKSKYEQLKGQQFLEAFNSLRGGGSITDIEGTKAEQAIAALRDPGISEDEFRRNAAILEDTIKRGVNRAREKVGQKPKYDVGTVGEPAKKANTPSVGTESTVGGVTYVFDGKGWKKK